MPPLPSNTLSGPLNPYYTLGMATQLHDNSIEYLTKTERLMKAIVELVGHSWAIVWVARTLERNAKAIYANAVPNNAHLAVRLDYLVDSALLSRNKFSSSGLSAFLARRYLLKDAVWLARAACVLRGENPASIPTLDPLWRSAAGALSDIFRVV